MIPVNYQRLYSIYNSKYFKFALDPQLLQRVAVHTNHRFSPLKSECQNGKVNYFLFFSSDDFAEIWNLSLALF